MSARDGQKCQKACSGEIIHIPHSVEFMRVTPSLFPMGGGSEDATHLLDFAV